MECLSLFKSEQGLSAGLAYQPTASDVFIATYPKCGTTWVQQLVHCLRTRGDMDFGEITDVVPWLEMSYDLGVDNNAPQKATPKCFKSHLSWNNIPKGGRYIHVTRNPEAVLRSFYRFFEGWFFETGSISLETFAETLFFGGSRSGIYWDHVNEWWPQRHREDVLFLCYEHMLDDPKRLIESVARFIKIDLDNDLLAIATEKSSADFMSRHSRQFDDHPLREKRNAACGLPPGGSSSKANPPAGKRDKRQLPDSIREKMDQAWHEIVERGTGLKSYENLLLEVQTE